MFAHHTAVSNAQKAEKEAQSPVTHLTMKAVEDLLPSKSFVRIHRSFIVNGTRIDSISAQGDIKVGGALLHVSEGYRDAFETFLG